MKKAILSMFALTTLSIGAAAQNDKADEKSLQKIVNTIETGWNTKSGTLFASVFADIHDYIVVNGMYMPGFSQKANAEAHQGLFNSVYREHLLTLKTDKIKFIKPDLAMMHVLGAGQMKGQPVPTDPGIIMTLLVEKKDNAWKIISFHNHEINMQELKQRNVPLNHMYANWYKN